MNSLMRKELAESIHAYRKTVFRVALGYVKNIHDADDISQNVFMKLGLNHSKVFDSPEAEKAWLIRVTINESKNFLKSAWLKNRNDLDESLATPASGSDKDSDICDYIKKLKPKYRTVIYLHYFEGYSTKEIASILKISQNAVTTQLSRARNTLKENLEEDLEKENNYEKLQALI